MGTRARERAAPPEVGSDAINVKSATRVLEILEYMCDADSPVSGTEISRALGYPQSSTSALMKTLTGLGYISFDRFGRNYRLAARSALIGSRAMGNLFGDGNLLRIMERLNRETGQTVILAAQVDMDVRIIHREGEGKLGATHSPRIPRRLINTASGRLFLSVHSDTIYIRALVRRLNADLPEHAERVDICELLEDLERIRQRGYAMSESVIFPGITGIAVLIPSYASEFPLSVVISGLSEEIVSSQEKYAQISINTINEFFSGDRQMR